MTTVRIYTESGSFSSTQHFRGTPESVHKQVQRVRHMVFKLTGEFPIAVTDDD